MKNMLKNTLIKTTGERIALPDGELSLDQMYKAIGCDTVEFVRLSNYAHLWCDENGLAVENPVMNLKATILYRDAVRSNEVGIVGNAIFSYETVRECPGCENEFDADYDTVTGAVSRYGHGLICSACGVREAFEGDFIAAQTDHIPTKGEI